MATKLKAMAEATGKSQGELAAEFGMSLVHMCKLLNGKAMPSMAVALRVAKKLRTTVDELWELSTENAIVARPAQNRRR